MLFRSKQKSPALDERGLLVPRPAPDCALRGRPSGALSAEERTRTSTGLPPPDPESGVSTNSTTSAHAKSRRDLAEGPGQVKTGPGLDFEPLTHAQRLNDAVGRCDPELGANGKRLRGDWMGRGKRATPKGRVLVVDDEQGFREGLADLLQMEGYVVSMARNAVEAVTLLPEFRPDVMVLDLRMPLLPMFPLLPAPPPSATPTG